LGGSSPLQIVSGSFTLDGVHIKVRFEMRLMIASIFAHPMCSTFYDAVYAISIRYPTNQPAVVNGDSPRAPKEQGHFTAANGVVADECCHTLASLRTFSEASLMTSSSCRGVSCVATVCPDHGSFVGSNRLQSARRLQAATGTLSDTSKRMLLATMLLLCSVLDSGFLLCVATRVTHQDLQHPLASSPTMSSVSHAFNSNTSARQSVQVPSAVLNWLVKQGLTAAQASALLLEPDTPRTVDQFGQVHVFPLLEALMTLDTNDDDADDDDEAASSHRNADTNKARLLGRAARLSSPQQHVLSSLLHRARSAAQPMPYPPAFTEPVVQQPVSAEAAALLEMQAAVHARLQAGATAGVSTGAQGLVVLDQRMTSNLAAHLQAWQQDQLRLRAQLMHQVWFRLVLQSADSSSSSDAPCAYCSSQRPTGTTAAGAVRRDWIHAVSGRCRRGKSSFKRVVSDMVHYSIVCFGDQGFQVNRYADYQRIKDMGFSDLEAARALLLQGYDIDNALNYLASLNNPAVRAL